MAADPWAITAYAYEPTAQVAAVTDADGRTTHFTYDRLNRLVLTIDPKGRTSGAVYDVEGQVLQTRRGDGSALAQAYETRTYTANGKLATYSIGLFPLTSASMRPHMFRFTDVTEGLYLALRRRQARPSSAQHSGDTHG